MSTLRRRLLMMVGNSLPNYSDYRGVYIEDVEGYLYTEDEWDGSKTANGIAVLTDNCRFVIGLYGIAGAVMTKRAANVTELPIYESIEKASNDFNGKGNTQIIVDAVNKIDSVNKDRFAARLCSEYIFPNGNKGYLGSLGEWMAVENYTSEIENILLRCGGDSILEVGRYWTSTRSSAYLGLVSFWYWLYGASGTNAASQYMYSSRAFTTLKQDEWSEEGGGVEGDEGGEGDSSTANIYWETQSGVWNKDIDASGNETYTCESPGDSGSTVIRCYFSGITSITFRCVSRGENNYDYLTIGEYDDYCTRNYYKESLKGKNGVITDVTYICNIAKHYVEFCYSKDSSDSESPDNATVYVASYSTE